jgi:hypothetical protein
MKIKKKLQCIQQTHLTDQIIIITANLKKNHILKAKMILAKWQLTCQSSKQLQSEVNQHTPHHHHHQK